MQQRMDEENAPQTAQDEQQLAEQPENQAQPQPQTKEGEPSQQGVHHQNKRRTINKAFWTFWRRSETMWVQHARHCPMGMSGVVQ